MMANNPSEQAARLLMDSVRANLEFIRRASEVGRVMLSDPSARPRSLPDLADRIVRFDLRMLEVLTSHSQAIMNEMLGAAHETLSGTTRPTAVVNAARPAPPPAAPALHLSGKAGASARAAFVVENPFSAPAALSFELEDFVSASGAHVHLSGVFDPPGPTLAPGGSQTIFVEVPLPQDVQPGSYTSQIHVVGYNTRQIRVTLQVEPGEPPPARPERRRRPPKSAA
jgi:hypothetical protein